MDKPNKINYSNIALSVPFVLASAVMVLWISWQLLSALNFSYPLWYRVLDIHEHIEKYAPQNRNRDNFIQTTVQERYRLFGEVVDSINAGGKGLETIRYHDVSGEPIDTMYTQQEVTHLKDVADLITVFDIVAYICMLAVLGYSVRFLGILGGGAMKPNWRLLHVAVFLLVVLAVVATIVIGPQKVFYFAHELVFPPDHPWFFYYQDSLMSTSMKAPDLFGGLAVQWLLVALTGYYLWIYLFSYLVKVRIRRKENRS